MAIFDNGTADLADDRLFVVNTNFQLRYDAGSVSILENPNSLDNGRRLSFLFDSFGGQIAISDDGQYAFMANRLSNVFNVVDIELAMDGIVSNEILASVPAGMDGYGVVMGIEGTPSSSFVYVSNMGSATVTVVDISNPIQPVRVDTNLEDDDEFTDISVDLLPTEMALSPDGNFLWVANRGSSSVSIIDTSTNEALTFASIPVFQNGDEDTSNPSMSRVETTSGITKKEIWTAIYQEADDGYYIVAGTTSGTQENRAREGVSYTSDGGEVSFTIVSGTSSTSQGDLFTFITYVSVPAGFGPQGITFSNDGIFAYVVTTGENSVSTFQAKDPKGDSFPLVPVATAEVGSFPVQMAVLSGTPSYGYVTNYSSNDLSVLNLVVHQEEGTIILDQEDLRGVAVGADYAFVPSGVGDQVGVVDINNENDDPEKPSFQSEVSSIDMRPGDIPKKVVLYGGRVYVLNEGSGDLAFFSAAPVDTSDPTRVVFEEPKYPEMASPLAPTDLEVRGSTGFVASAGDDDRVVVLDVSQESIFTELQSVAAGNDPVALDIYGTVLLVVLKGEDAVAVIDISDPANATVDTNIAVGTEPVDIEVQGSFAYVVNQSSNSLSIINLGNYQRVDTDGNVENGVQDLPFLLDQPSGITISGNFAYVWHSGLENGQDAVSVVNLQTRSLLDTDGDPDNGVQGITINLNGGSPSGFAAAGAFGYLSLEGGSALSAIALNHLPVDADPDVAGVQWFSSLTEQGPSGVLLLPGLEGRDPFLYISNFGSQSISLIQLQSPENPQLETILR